MREPARGLSASWKGSAMDEKKQDASGAYAWKPLLEEQESPPEEFTNPAGASRGECDTEKDAEPDASCDLEVTAQVQDFVLEETKPGTGIDGFEESEDAALEGIGTRFGDYVHHRVLLLGDERVELGAIGVGQFFGGHVEPAGRSGAA